MYLGDDFEDQSFTDFDEEDDLYTESENYIVRTYVCEECDFRWTEKINLDNNDYPDYDDELGQAHICPMCGSDNVSFY